ncbi:hypothetical protein HGP16_08960 [Rhizobium sp. P40RR-XXII]|uniref:hypothetical protein n=1 Tax=unclassified Rhizobium TaxID=2613769 RepID=UPI0014567508|nr:MULTISPECIES: hypothetical protein [unclassified Rhizobium]NLR85336.1 hypothetical protein [Rhizobium sp. P28RR-XV]NLS16687.1 hypothetical protein [Rhizobium sp. P40RR-XXII]
MKRLLVGTIFAIAGSIPLYLISERHARADDWGCQVILCLSNPGGPTQYAACHPPISKLWQELAKGHSFPTCSGVGFRASRPGYEPYFCSDSYRLTTRYGERGQQETCVSRTLSKVDGSYCASGRDGSARDDGLVISARWQRDGRHMQCMGYPTARPNVRSEPHYVDVTIDGVGSQRVWY